jgi:hypothetical protein
LMGGRASPLLKAMPLELGSFRREDRPGAVRAGSFLPRFAQPLPKFAPICRDLPG